MQWLREGAFSTMPSWVAYVQVHGRETTAQAEDLMAIDYGADRAAVQLGYSGLRSVAALLLCP